MFKIKPFKAYYPNTGHTPDECLALKSAGFSIKELAFEGRLDRSTKEQFYIYRLGTGTHIQDGLVAILDIRDYIDGKIKRHEMTRNEKVSSQAERLLREGCLSEPILLSFDSAGHRKNHLTEWADSRSPVFDYFDDNAVSHTLWGLTDKPLIAKLRAQMTIIDSLYICDGHHRLEALAQLYKKTKDVSFRYFMAVIYPSEEMQIIDFNRAVKGLNGLSRKGFIAALKDSGFEIESASKADFRPSSPGEYGMALGGSWYRIRYGGKRTFEDPISHMDISILQDVVLSGILGIDDPQTDPRITFISGEKGLSPLSHASRFDDSVAFAICPVTISDILRVSAAGLSMPPKSSRFYPRLHRGMLFYTAE